LVKLGAYNLGTVASAVAVVGNLYNAAVISTSAVAISL
jgi:hypothetical protein